MSQVNPGLRPTSDSGESGAGPALSEFKVSIEFDVRILEFDLEFDESQQ